MSGGELSLGLALLLAEFVLPGLVVVVPFFCREEDGFVERGSGGLLDGGFKGAAVEEAMRAGGLEGFVARGGGGCGGDCGWRWWRLDVGLDEAWVLVGEFAGTGVGLREVRGFSYMKVGGLEGVLTMVAYFGRFWCLSSTCSGGVRICVQLKYIDLYSARDGRFLWLILDVKRRSRRLLGGWENGGLKVQLFGWQTAKAKSRLYPHTCRQRVPNSGPRVHS